MPRSAHSGDDRRSWRRPPAWFVAVSALTAAAAGAAVLYGALAYAPAREREAHAEWQARLASVVENRRAAVESWVTGYIGDALTLATFPSALQLLAPGGAAALPHVRDVYEQVAANKHFDGAWLLDSAGAVRLHVGARDPEPARPVVVEFARRVLTGGGSVDVALVPGRGQLVLLGSPVWLDARMVGVAVIQMDAREALWEVVGTGPSPTRTGELQLVTQVGDSVLYLTPSRFDTASTPRQLRLPLRRTLAAAAAVSGAQAFGEFRDYRGKDVFAATIRLANAPWALVAKIDCEEVDAEVRAHVWQYAGGSVAAVALLSLALLFLGFQHARRLESERRESEARLRQLAENAGDIIYRYRISPQPACEYINPAVTRITGFSPEECYADPSLPRQRVHPGDAGHFAQLVALPRTGEPAAFRWFHKDGSERMLELLNIPVRAEDGTVVAIEGVARDVTRVYEQEVALRRSEERHRTLFENLAQGIVYYDYEHDRVTLNAAAEEILGLTAAELQRRGPAGIAAFEEDGRPIPPARLPGAVALQTGEAVPHRVVRLRNGRDGRYRWVLIGSRPLVHAERGEVFAVYTTLADITAIRDAEAELRDTRELFRQAQKMEAVGRLAGGVAHDFNNLITAIKGYAALLLQALPAGSTERNDATEISRAADRAAALTRQLLAFSRKQVLEPRVLRLDVVLRELEQMIRRLIGEDVTLVLETQQELWPVLADAVQIEQVLLNLVVNSRDALHWGGRIDVQLRNVIVPPGADGYELPPAPGEYVAITVADSGSGMSADTLQHIFEPFFTTKEIGRGTGLGLPTVYGIVQQSGGGIRVESRPGEGSTFEILLPRAAEPVARPAPPPPPPGPAAGGERVLVVEDEPPVRELVRRMLESAGYTVAVAATGRDAIMLLAGQRDGFDLLLTDVVMPGMSGSALAREFLARCPAGRLVYTSGYSEEFIARQGVPDPPALLLQKPFTQEMLQRAVRAALDSPPPGARADADLASLPSGP